ncbi:MAG TPA: PP2C family protein-serine/threonine phosphatase [Anaerolineae bacterium]|nr:PP2C family protein-serine/threonine phosphatase [Anaerolineae bacterium]
MALRERDTSLEREMEIARRIQASFLPQVLPQFPGWEIATRFEPARQVAGDFYDAFPLVQNRRLGLVIGDVCDKGVGAALFMALFRTLIRAFAQQHYALRWMADLQLEGPARDEEGERPSLPSIGTTALKNAVELTNRYMASTHGSSHMFATLFFGVLDPATGLLLFINGGHEPPLLIGASGVKAELGPTGPLVGIFAEAQFEIGSVRVEPGDTLLAFTDGVTEARNANGDLFGRDRLRTLLARPVLTASELLDYVQAHVDEHVSGADTDDLALLALHRQPG